MYIIEIDCGPILPQERMTEDILNKHVLRRDLYWWEMKGDVRNALTYDEDRKEALEALKDILPNCFELDVDNGIITCSGDKNEYLKDTLLRLRKLTYDPVKIMAEEEPLLWWRWEVDRFLDVLFVGWFHAWDVLTLNEFVLLTMGKSFGKENAFYIGGIFEVMPA